MADLWCSLVKALRVDLVKFLSEIFSASSLCSVILVPSCLPVSPIYTFSHWLHGTVSGFCKPKLWKRYVDDILEIIKRGKVEALTDHLNGIDKTNSIKFTHEPEKNGQIPFLDTLITRRKDGSIKLLVYRKATHTDQRPVSRKSR